MGLLQRAVETYDCFADRAGQYYEYEAPLVPISHITTSADIEITLDQDGEYVTSRLTDKREPKIIIPVTEESAGRTSAPSPHPLCDQLAYVAGFDEEKYKLYLELLSQWVTFDPENRKLRAVRRYVERRTMLQDLVRDQVISLNTEGKPEDEKLLIRWRVQDGAGEDACWKDQELFRSFIRFYEARQQKNKRQLCMVTGQMEPAAVQNPKGIIPVYGNAKLISSNDTKGFTYLGRFDANWQAATVGYTASQKAHNALRWLVANQGVRISFKGEETSETKDERSYSVYGGRTFLCWNPQGRSAPPVTLPILKKTAKRTTDPSDYQKQLREVLLGYQKDLPEDAKAVIASFDAATTGRLAVTYYNELNMYDFLERLKAWDEICCWENGVYGFQSPPLLRIVQYAYGSHRNGQIELPKDGILRQQMQRLIACRVGGFPIPGDFERSLVSRASNLVIYDTSTRIQLISITCAVIRKYYYDQYKEEIGVGLDKENTDPSYLFGRLLAVYEKVEADTFEAGEKRETNAMRYQSAFVQRPLSTWKMLEMKMGSYYRKINLNRPASYYWYKGLIAEIAEKLEADGKGYNQKLGDTYLIGYYHQRADLYKKKETK